MEQFQAYQSFVGQVDSVQGETLGLMEDCCEDRDQFCLSATYGWTDID